MTMPHALNVQINRNLTLRGLKISSLTPSTRNQLADALAPALSTLDGIALSSAVQAALQNLPADLHRPLVESVLRYVDSADYNPPGKFETQSLSHTLTWFGKDTWLSSISEYILSGFEWVSESPSFKAFKQSLSDFRDTLPETAPSPTRASTRTTTRHPKPLYSLSLLSLFMAARNAASAVQVAAHPIDYAPQVPSLYRANYSLTAALNDQYFFTSYLTEYTPPYATGLGVSYQVTGQITNEYGRALTEQPIVLGFGTTLFHLRMTQSVDDSNRTTPALLLAWDDVRHVAVNETISKLDHVFSGKFIQFDDTQQPFYNATSRTFSTPANALPSHATSRSVHTHLTSLGNHHFLTTLLFKQNQHTRGALAIIHPNAIPYRNVEDFSGLDPSSPLLAVRRSFSSGTTESLISLQFFWRTPYKTLETQLWVNCFNLSPSWKDTPTPQHQSAIVTVAHSVGDYYAVTQDSEGYPVMAWSVPLEDFKYELWVSRFNSPSAQNFSNHTPKRFKQIVYHPSEHPRSCDSYCALNFPQITALSQGGFLISWRERPSSDKPSTHFIQALDPSFNTMSHEYRLYSEPADEYQHPLQMTEKGDVFALTLNGEQKGNPDKQPRITSQTREIRGRIHRNTSGSGIGTLTFFTDRPTTYLGKPSETAVETRRVDVSIT